MSPQPPKIILKNLISYASVGSWLQRQTLALCLMRCQPSWSHLGCVQVVWSRWESLWSSLTSWQNYCEIENHTDSNIVLKIPWQSCDIGRRCHLIILELKIAIDCIFSWLFVDISSLACCGGQQRAKFSAGEFVLCSLLIFLYRFFIVAVLHRAK